MGREGKEKGGGQGALLLRARVAFDGVGVGWCRLALSHFLTCVCLAEAPMYMTWREMLVAWPALRKLEGATAHTFASPAGLTGEDSE